ncbi:MAG: transposase, partial [Candidatus Moduliflexus flocculans]|nr:transposase [Candidatus Moduliflexus flocculans]
MVVDTTGYPLVVVVHAANIYDGHAAERVLNALFSIVKTVKKIWADGAYKGEKFIGAGVLCPVTRLTLAIRN